MANLEAGSPRSGKYFGTNWVSWLLDKTNRVDLLHQYNQVKHLDKKQKYVERLVHLTQKRAFDMEEIPDEDDPVIGDNSGNTTNNYGPSVGKMAAAALAGAVLLAGGGVIGAYVASKLMAPTQDSGSPPPVQEPDRDTRTGISIGAIPWPSSPVSSAIKQK